MLKVKRRLNEGTMVVDLDGAIDGSESCRAIHEAIAKSLAEGQTQFVFNLEKVDWLNSLGTGFLVAAAVSASRQGAVVRLVGLVPRVAGVLKACGVVPHVWKDYPDVE